LTVLEYQLDPWRPQGHHGAEDGQLRLSDARRLVDVAQDAIIVELDCGTTRGLK
jgi:hypothetical protein